jgi:hypothetical protein
VEAVRIVCLAIAAAVLYGIAHDQVTARVCVEYFTVAHPPVFRTQSPTLLGLGWGIIATWWVGALLGVPLACACRIGVWPKLKASELLQPLGVLLICMAVASIAAGTLGYSLARSGWLRLTGPLAGAIPSSRHSLFIADLWAHSAAYAVGFFGGVAVCIHARLRRWRLRTH